MQQILFYHQDNYNLQMGNISEFDKESQYFNYSQAEQGSNKWAGQYIIMSDSINNKKVLKKTIYLRSHKEASQFVEEYKSQYKPDFYVINPLYVDLTKGEGLCSLSQTVNVFHKNLLPTLQDRLKKAKHPLKQHEIWFILSQITHSLQILHKLNHPHLWICPETIYYNKDDNWFLQDLHYWRGPDFQNLIKQKYESQQIMSEYMKKIVSRSDLIDINTACEQDVYCLGYTTLLMMHGGKIPNIQKNSNIMLERAGLTYSKKLTNIIRLMIQEIPEKRLALDKLKFKLKMQEEDIMKEQMAQFKREQKKSRQRLDTEYKQKVINNGVPPINLSTNKKQSRADSYLTTALNSRNMTPFATQQRRNYIYYSPPTHRITEMRSPSYDRFGRRITQFRYNSPRKF